MVYQNVSQSGPLSRLLTIKTRSSTRLLTMLMKDKLVIPDSVNLAVLQACHEDKRAGHFGTIKTHHRIAEKILLARMLQDVKKYVCNIDTCKANKPAKMNKTYQKGKIKDIHENPGI
jgi:hypothetical protein